MGFKKCRTWGGINMDEFWSSAYPSSPTWDEREEEEEDEEGEW